MAYVIARSRKTGTRYKGMYLDADGTYKSAGTYIGKRQVTEISRETIHRLLTVVLPEAGASQTTAINTRTCLSVMLQMAWDHGYRSDNPVKGIRLKHPPSKPVVVATPGQCGGDRGDGREGRAEREERTTVRGVVTRGHYGLPFEIAGRGIGWAGVSPTPGPRPRNWSARMQGLHRAERYGRGS